LGVKWGGRGAIWGVRAIRAAAQSKKARTGFRAAIQYGSKALKYAKTKIGNSVRSFARNNRFFGYKKGSLNKGPNRIGFSKCESNICFRWGKAGSHSHRFSVRLPVKWPGYK
jgi:hypothetical protein